MSTPNDRALEDYHGEQILLPEDIKLHPNPVQLAWNWRNRFLGCNYLRIDSNLIMVQETLRISFVNNDP